MIDNFSFEDVEKVARNRYEAVLIAAQRARQINSLRLAQLERMTEENITIDGRKVTSLALKDLAENKVKFRRAGEPEEE
jgi:DNA-directed RNA polymerase omega subunit